MKRRKGFKISEAKKKSMVSWIIDFAGRKKETYVLSVILAIMGALCHIVLYFVLAYIIQLLLS